MKIIKRVKSIINRSVVAGLLLFLFIPISGFAATALASDTAIGGSTQHIDFGEAPAGLSADDWVQIKTQLHAPAAYPATQQAYLKASNTDANDQFGCDVAISGNTVVVAAFHEDSNATGVNGNQADNSATSAGAVYVFVRNGTTWSQQAYLKASNTRMGAYSRSVSISGDTLVVGSHNESSNATGVNGDQNNTLAGGSGAAYVYVRTGSTWSQQAYIKASNTGANDRFGWDVSLSGNTLVVGATHEASNATGVNGNEADNSTPQAGAAYVFTRTGTTWSQQAYLKAPNPETWDIFGFSVSVSGDTIVVGSHGEDSNATGVNGDPINNLADGSGAAYVFTRTGTTWSQQAYLKAGNTGSDDAFGVSVSIYGDTLVVGAAGEDSNATGVNGDPINNLADGSGAAYVFTRTGATWSQQAYLKASDTLADDHFGASVSNYRNSIAVGATGESGTGAVYIFNLLDTTWSQQAYLKATNPGTNDRFGNDVAISDYYLSVGAPYEDSNTTGVNGDQINNSASDAGAAYIFSVFNQPDPFLDLPINYTGTSFSIAANGNPPGRVNSWFDHENPNYTKNNYVLPWHGKPLSDLPEVKCQFGLNCYDGHNGIDFQGQKGDTVYAAAPGIVVDLCNNYPCTRPLGSITSSYSYGKWVLIQHDSKYATFYAHLDTINPSLAIGTEITDTKVLEVGTVGGTGGHRPHLHFGVYFDANDNGKWEEIYQGYSEAVDPYGWDKTSPDPWSVPSTYLWINSLIDEDTSDSSGGTYFTPSGRAQLDIPMGALSDLVTLEMWDAPPVSAPSAQLRSTGNSFWAIIKEWLTGDNTSTKLALSSLESSSTNSFNTPVTVTVKFDPLSIPHLDISQLAIQQWDETGQMWIPLVTSVDTINNQASAQTYYPGYFDLQGLLVCPADILEPNDNYDGSSVVQTNGSLVNNLFDIAQDEDWFQFDALSGNTYTLKTSNLAASVDTILELYDTDGVTLLATDDNGGGGKASSLTWQAPQDGAYFARAKQASGSSFGCSSAYSFSVTEIDGTAPSMVSINRVNTNPTNLAKVDFLVTFSEPVLNVTQSDFRLVSTGIPGVSIASVSGSGTIYIVSINTGNPASGLININTASLQDLDSLSGIGPTIAQRIIDYRTLNGPFTWIQDIMNVPGIGSATFAEIQDLITVGNGLKFRLDVPISATITDLVGNPLGDLPFTNGETYTIIMGATFSDVPINYWSWDYIERLYSAGITGGCSTTPLSYCPENSVTRAQMAIFLEKGLYYPGAFSPANVAPTFNDTVAHWAEDWIEALRSDGITGGCGPNLYCPENPVTRAQMAVFLLKSKYGSSYTPPAVGSSTGFTDVPTTHWAAPWIKQLAAEGITGGCGAGIYCPDSPVTRAQMAVFLVRTFNLP